MAMKMWNTLVGRILIVVGVLAVPIASRAQTYPSRPVHLVVPYPPGGGIDPAARVYARVLAEELGQPIVVMNVAGASGQIGTGMVARAAADGYTLLFASVAPNSILPAANPDLPYSSKDFVSVSLVGVAGYVLVVNPAVPARNVQELLTLVRASPEKIATFASSGVLGGPHLAGELLKTLGHVQMTHVPYRGDGPAVTAVIAGEVPLMFASAPAAMPHVNAGRLRALAVSGGRRLAALPDIPALAEILPGHEVSQWYGLMVPAGTPQPIVDKLYRATVTAVASPMVKEQYSGLGIDPTATSPEEFKAFVQSEIQKWKNVIREANISPE
jgi:tripartite-type tricarboxylate transporter receptor subunit TctC